MSQIACHECDLLLNLPSLAEGKRAYCPRCNELLCTHRHDGLDRALSYAVTSMLFLVLANIFPFLAFKEKGHEQVMTLLQTSFELYHYGSVFLAFFVLAFIIIAPAILLSCVICVLGPLVFNGVCVKGSVFLGRLIFHLTPWSMAEVFLIGVLVSMIKIAALATVALGLSFFAYIGFTVCFILMLSSLDNHQFWDAIEKGQR